MAGFKTHVTISSLAGIGYGGVAHWLYGVPIPTCALAGGLCAVSGMLPDIDSDSGRPLRESMAFAAAIVPMMLLERLARFKLPTETTVLFGAFIYLAIRFGFAGLLKKFTTHRGMFHSLPAAIIFGEIAFLLASGDDLHLRYYKAGGVVLGYVSHLMLDEIYSFEWSRGRFRIKKSFGTGVKILGHGFLPNVVTYAFLALFTTLAINEPAWMHKFAPPSGQDRQYASQPGAGQNGDADPDTLLEALRTEFGEPTTWLK